jgi:glycine/D-amino acid oxidase-like deaminating enzyme
MLRPDRLQSAAKALITNTQNEVRVTVRICIIGAGIVGSSIAYELSKAATNEVSVVDAGYPGWQATAASFAWINANAKEPRSYFELNWAGMREYDRLASELPSDRWLNKTGCLVTTPADDEAEVRVARAHDLGYPGKLLSSDQVMEAVEPALRLRPNRQVAYFPVEAWLDVESLIQMSLGAASERGALCHYGRAVVGIERRSNGTFKVELNDSTSIEADTIVNAAGAGADKVAKLLGRRLVLAPTLGITMRVRSERFALRSIVRNVSVDARPDGPGLFRLHANSIDEKIARGGQDRNVIAAEFMRRADLLFNGFEDAVVIDTRIAPRPNPQDGLTWVGPVAGIDGYFECVTHSGVTLGALLGRLVAEEVTSGRRSQLLDEFRPDRGMPVSA